MLMVGLSVDGPSPWASIFDRAGRGVNPDGEVSESIPLEDVWWLRDADGIREGLVLLRPAAAFLTSEKPNEGTSLGGWIGVRILGVGDSVWIPRSLPAFGGTTGE